MRGLLEPTAVTAGLPPDTRPLPTIRAVVEDAVAAATKDHTRVGNRNPDG